MGWGCANVIAGQAIGLIGGEWSGNTSARRLDIIGIVLLLLATIIFAASKALLSN